VSPDNFGKTRDSSGVTTSMGQDRLTTSHTPDNFPGGDNFLGRGRGHNDPMINWLSQSEGKKEVAGFSTSFFCEPRVGWGSGWHTT